MILSAVILLGLFRFCPNGRLDAGSTKVVCIVVTFFIGVPAGIDQLHLAPRLGCPNEHASKYSRQENHDIAQQSRVAEVVEFEALLIGING